MKKKGRVCGTIGFLLAVALVGGTVVYSSMFDAHAAAKAQKPIGTATGNFVNAITKKEGYDETKKFVTESVTLIESKGTGTYTSYSSKFSLRYESKIKEGGADILSVTELSGVLYTDDAYTYITAEATIYTDRETEYERADVVYDKNNGDLWVMAPVSYPQNGTDTSYFKDVKWEKEESASLDDLGISEVFELIASAFESTAEVKFDYLSGAFSFETVAEGATDKCTFTVGYSPRITRVTTVSVSGSYMYVNATIDYSDLNNTAVNLPKTLVAVKGA